MVLDSKAREALAGLSRTLGSGLGRLGVTPNSVTAAGVILTGVAAWQVIDAELVRAGWILAAAGILDFLDGAVARATGKATKLGAFLDSVTDRVSDLLILGCLFWYLLATRSDELAASLALASLGLAQLISYVRAKAESLGYDCKVGIMERAERVVVLVVGLVFGWLTPALGVLGGLSAVTLAQRLVHVGKQARAAP